MLITELMLKLDDLLFEHGNIEVGAQSHGCCHHVHEIITVEYDAGDEMIAIRV